LCEYPKDKGSAKLATAERIKRRIKDSNEQAGHKQDNAERSDGIEDKTDLPAVDPFPIEVFPAVLQRYIREGAEAYGCCVDYFGHAMIAVAATAIGASREIELKDTFRTCPSVYAASIGRPGSAKSPVLARVMLPVQERQEKLMAEFRKEWRRYREEMERRAGAKRTLKAKKANANSESANQEASGFASLRVFDDMEIGPPPEPKLKRIVTSDCTVEALVEIMADNPRGFGLIRDELVAWVKGMDMYRRGKGTDRQFFLSALGGASYSSDRKSNKGKMPINIPKPYLCVLGCLTPDMLSEFADEHERDDGFLDRILAIYPDDQSFPDWNESIISEEADRAWRDVLDALFDLACEVKHGRPVPQTIQLTQSAKDLFVELYNRLGQEALAPDFPVHLRGTWSKYRLYVARLALILHLIRSALGEVQTADMADEISVSGAVALVDYYSSHAVRVNTLLAKMQPASSQATTQIVDAIEKVVAAGDGDWLGTAEGLLAAMNAGAQENKPREWPTSPAGLGRAVRRLDGTLKRAKGIEVEYGRRSPDRARTRLLSLKKVSDVSEVSADAVSQSEAESCDADTSADASAPGNGSVRDGRTLPDPQREPSEEASGAQSYRGQALRHPPDASDTSDTSSANQDEIEEGEL
jgi:hypothetical protein